MAQQGGVEGGHITGDDQHALVGGAAAQSDASKCALTLYVVRVGREAEEGVVA